MPWYLWIIKSQNPSKGRAHIAVLNSVSKARSQACNTADTRIEYCIACQFDLCSLRHCYSFCHCPPLVSEGWVKHRAPVDIEPTTFESPCQCCYRFANFTPHLPSLPTNWVQFPQSRISTCKQWTSLRSAQCFKLMANA